ncbi:hypothetical protein [uncultured Erythrobacter sp.]|uniref:hypothetical protein n=1 Tax=uncultured Erythrobacter sp. TaxID=263913 RepID=UPI00265849F7|nr:hypothetical protein [uncultured Erythrobacter sp.]
MTRRTDPRTARLPVAQGELPPFTPVPRQYERHDGWTPARQIAFIEALADTGSVKAAARAVDMSAEGAYHLRRQPGAESFRAAWEAALQLGVARIEDVVMDRALNGVEEPLYSYGKLIGTRTRYNDRLLMFILRNRAPERFAAGGGPKGLNAVSQMQLDRLKQEWIAEHEASKPQVSAEDVRRSIDRKVEEIRLRLRHESEHRWAALTEETRTAWAHFISLRDRDLDAMRADAKTREVLDVKWNAAGDRFDAPERKLLPRSEDD